MKKYKVCYLAEQKDECVDLEITLECNHIIEVFAKFQEQVKFYKRITSVTELHNQF
jgi:hypothetical protein